MKSHISTEAYLDMALGTKIVYFDRFNLYEEIRIVSLPLATTNLCHQSDQ